jgi:S-adenosylmethionine-diacylglycerol 3-amino-3-carboxypropyl transferase
VHGRRRVAGWFDLGSVDAQREYYARVWDTWRWRGLFRLFFSKRVMAARGRSPEQFAHVQGEIGDVLLGRARHVLCDLPLRDNGYVQWMLMGDWAATEGVPEYLTERGHAALGEVVERTTFLTAPLEQHLEAVAPGTYDGFNLSDVFEYLSEPVTAGLLAGLARAGRPGARLAWWELFVRRARPDSLGDRLRSLPDLGERLHEVDRAFVYGGFRVEEVL